MFLPISEGTRLRLLLLLHLILGFGPLIRVVLVLFIVEGDLIRHLEIVLESENRLAVVIVRYEIILRILVASFQQIFDSVII
jgi:hypothetical protein